MTDPRRSWPFAIMLGVVLSVGLALVVAILALGLSELLYQLFRVAA